MSDIRLRELVQLKLDRIEELKGNQMIRKVSAAIDRICKFKQVIEDIDDDIKKENSKERY